IVGANEEVLCWDIKKGELLHRWRDPDCKAQVTAIAQSKTDEDVFAVGYENRNSSLNMPALTDYICLQLRGRDDPLVGLANSINHRVVQRPQNSGHPACL